LEFDLLVAKAVGATTRTSEHEGYRACVADWNGSRGVIWRPTTHWADAMDAFVRADEGDNRAQICLEPSGNWYCNIGGQIARASTGQLAICRAIADPDYDPSKENER
jgi:hypothetical protein